MINEFKKALKNDRNLYHELRRKIAIQFQIEYNRNPAKYKNIYDIQKISNKAAKNFLDMLIKDWFIMKNILNKKLIVIFLSLTFFGCSRYNRNPVAPKPIIPDSTKIRGRMGNVSVTGPASLSPSPFFVEGSAINIKETKWKQPAQDVV